MNKYEIVEQLARARKVEEMVSNIAHSPLTDDLRDLCQMVYAYLLEYDDDKIADLHDHNQMGFFIARIVINQFRSKHSPWHDLIRKPRLLATDIDTLTDK